MPKEHKWRFGFRLNWGAKRNPTLRAALFKEESELPPQLTEVVIGDGDLDEQIQKAVANIKVLTDNEDSKK